MRVFLCLLLILATDAPAKPETLPSDPYAVICEGTAASENSTLKTLQRQKVQRRLIVIDESKLSAKWFKGSKTIQFPQGTYDPICTKIIVRGSQITARSSATTDVGDVSCAFEYNKVSGKVKYTQSIRFSASGQSRGTQDLTCKATSIPDSYIEFNRR